MVETTPMMAQYHRIKSQFGESILFFRLGDFYEMFESDAREASAILDLTLTRRAGVPMCGIPYHAAPSYISRLLAAGRKVAICEQVTQPGKGLMSREVVEVITPGTVLDDNYLSRTANNYLISLGRVGNMIGIAYADVSTGEFSATSFPFEERGEMLKRELHRLDPREALTQESLLVEDPVIRGLLGERAGLLVNRYPDWSFDAAACKVRLLRQLGVANLKGFGLTDDSPEVVAAGVLLEYLGETARRSLRHFASLQVYADRSYVELDEATQRNLELLTNLQEGSGKFTLLSVLDHTRTSPGARKLRRWILTPLKDVAAIDQRLNAVAALHGEQILLARLRECLGSVLDLERLTARVGMERAHAKDLLSIKSTLEAVLALAALFEKEQGKEIRPHLARILDPMSERAGEIRILAEHLERAICDEPSILLTEGSLIRRGYNAELDRLHGLKDNSRGTLEEYLATERAETGIGSLKLRYNRIIGYYFEVTKSNLPLVPKRFIRRQSLVGGERYTTDRLSSIEREINDASERIVEMERTLFLEVRAQVLAAVPCLLSVCSAISELDVFQSMAFAATVHAWSRPRMTAGTELSIEEGRHPVVEAHLPGGAFVPNSLECPGTGRFFVLLTGPNMAGKSTFLRQVALIALMAQMGSFVPAARATIGVVDRVFCRVGATDNLARGESTFLVEMNETAHILRAATTRSLIIMDEIGRGTSTRDGLAIAWAVCMSILTRIRARTLFATHFHELTRLDHESAANLSMEVHDTEGEVVFLKKVREGPSSNSYGIHVARLAGIPAETLRMAETMLLKLNTQPGAADGNPGAFAEAAEAALKTPVQPQLFSGEELIVQEIKGLQPDLLTPLEALTLLARWKKELANGGNA